MSAQRVTAAQLAGLPGMPKDKSGVIRRATAEGWAFDEEPGRGGMRRLFHVSQLPPATRAALQWQQPSVVVPGSTPEQAQAWVASSAQSAGARLALREALDSKAGQAKRQAALRDAGGLAAQEAERMDAKLAVLRAFETFAKAAQLPLHHARISFCLAYNDGRIDMPARVRELVPRTSDSSLERWQKTVREQGITALAGAYGNRAGSGLIDSQPPVRDYVKAMLVQYPHARATQVLKALRGRFAAPDSPVRAQLPSIRVLERWMADWRQANAEVLLALANPDAWKNRHMVAFGSKSEAATYINALWERDSSPADVMCLDGRYTLIGGIDVFTRRAALLVSKTSKAVAVGAHLRLMLQRFGVPTVDKTDNGSDYTALYMDRVYRGLDIEHALCPPFQPWHKPHVERFFGTFTRDLVELLPGYIGHSVAERSAIEARKSFADRLMTRGEVVELRMTGAELQAFCDRWLDTVYHQQPHEGLGGRTPFLVAAEQAAEVRWLDDERALDVLLAEAPGRDGRRTVQKKGIKLDEGWFIAPELEAWVGREVQVRYDPVHHDLGTVFVFGGDALAFICLAQCPERTGMDRREVAVKAKAMQTARVQAERKALKAAAKKLSPDRVVDEILRERAAAAGVLSALPVRGQVHTSTGLQAAAEAHAQASSGPRSTADLVELLPAQAALMAEAERQAAPRPAELSTPVFESPAQRVDWLLRQQQGRALGAEEAAFLTRYRAEQPAAYRRLAALVAEQSPTPTAAAPDAAAN